MRTWWLWLWTTHGLQLIHSGQSNPCRECARYIQPNGDNCALQHTCCKQRHKSYQPAKGSKREANTKTSHMYTRKASSTETWRLEHRALNRNRDAIICESRAHFGGFVTPWIPRILTCPPPPHNLRILRILWILQ